MSIRAFQVNNGLVTPLADRTLYSFISGDMAGIIKNGCRCTLSADGKHITVSDGWGIIKGCLFQVKEETVAIDTSEVSAQTSGCFGIHLDISGGGDENPVIRFFDVIGSDSYTPIQEDINTDGTIYEILLATYTINANGEIDEATFESAIDEDDQINSQNMVFPIGPTNGDRKIKFRSVVNSGNYIVTGILTEGNKSEEIMVIDEYGNILPGIGKRVGGANQSPDGSVGTVPSNSWDGYSDNGITWTIVGHKYINDIPEVVFHHGGRWLVILTGKFYATASASSYSTGSCGIGIINNVTGAGVSPSPGAYNYVPWIAGSKSAKVQVSAVIDINVSMPTQTVGFVFKAFQNTGASLGLTCNYTLVRLGDVPRDSNPWHI